MEAYHRLVTSNTASLHAAGARRPRYVVVWGLQGRCACCRQFVPRVFAAAFGNGSVWCRGCAEVLDERRDLAGEWEQTLAHGQGWAA